MKAKSIKGKSTEEIQSELMQSMSDGFKPTLAILFISVKQDIVAITSLLHDQGISIFGATSAGEFTERGITNGAVSILLLDIDAAYFRIVLKDIGSHSQDEIADLVAREGKAIFSNPAFIISATFMDIHGEAVAKSFLEVIGEDVTVIGGVAGDDYTFKGGLVFTNDKISSKGIIALILNQDKVIVKGQAVSGWKAVGTPKEITKSEGSWVYTIDDQPALDMLLKYTGIKIDPDSENEIYTKLGSTYPLQVIRDKGSPVMKPPLQYNHKTRAVMFGGIVPQGSLVRFSLPPDFDVIETVIESANKIRRTSLPEADAMMIFSCIGRLENLGPMVETEITGLKEVWNVPIAGFFTYGEFGTPEGGNADFHGTTCSWVVLKEI